MPMFVLPGKWPGLIRKGNIDLARRQVLELTSPRCCGGQKRCWATFYTSSKEFNGLEVLFPGVIGCKLYTNVDFAFQHFRKTGQHLGMFNNARNATRYGVALHSLPPSFFKGHPTCKGRCV